MQRLIRAGADWLLKNEEGLTPEGLIQVLEQSGSADSSRKEQMNPLRGYLASLREQSILQRVDSTAPQPGRKPRLWVVVQFENSDDFLL